MILALTEIGVSVIWYISKYTLWGTYKILHYLWYGSQPDPEDIRREDLEKRIKELEEKLSSSERINQNESLNDYEKKQNE